MKEKGILRDKIEQLRIQPSKRAWRNIERSLDRDSRSKVSVRRSTLGLVAAIVLVVIAYFLGARNLGVTEYSPATLEINDQASEILWPSEYYEPASSEMHYRKNGRLIPNSQTLWEHPLVPRVN